MMLIFGVFSLMLKVLNTEQMKRVKFHCTVPNLYLVATVGNYPVQLHCFTREWLSFRASWVNESGEIVQIETSYGIHPILCKYMP